MEADKQNQNKSTSNSAQNRTYDLEKVKDLLSIAQSAVTILAIIVGGFWFLMQSEVSPKANISHEVTHRQIDENNVWVHVSVKVTNPGKRPLELKSGTFRIQGILPLDQDIKQKIKGRENLIAEGARTVEWPQICEYKGGKINLSLDPGESEKLKVEFIVPSIVKTVSIYSYLGKSPSIWQTWKNFFQNGGSPKLGWTETSIYDLKREERPEGGRKKGG